MYDELPADIRPGHPFHMYDEIHLQPQAVSESLRLAIRHGSHCGGIERARRVIVTGCGTSFHAALGAAWLLRSFTRGRIDARAIEAFELVQYGADMRPDDVLIAISHSGTSTMPIRAMQRAREVGAETVLITGLPERGQERGALCAAHRLPWEKSWAHTISYTAALASAAAIANVLADSSEKLDLSPLTDVVADALRSEDTAHRMAASVLLSEQENGPARLVFGWRRPPCDRARSDP
jgi:glucosamine 6-phosphate synthetase-like amidotransferase/phosphosugar isomerase protein